MPITDVMPVANWRDIQALLVKTRTPSDLEIAEKLMGEEKFKYAQSFRHLRSAVFFLFQNLQVENKRVIFPKYICGSVIRAAEKVGFKVTLCEVDYRGGLDIDELEKLPLKKFSILFIVHPFGIKIDSERVRKICEKNKIFLVEDCAHNLQIRPVGDFVLFHFAKRIANAHGGILISKKLKFDEVAKRAFPMPGEIISMILKWRPLRFLLNIYRSTKGIPQDHDIKSDKNYLRLLAASDGSKRVFWRALKSKEYRQSSGESTLHEIYRQYMDKVPVNFKVLCSEPIQDFFNFPVLVPKDKSRDEILKKLRVYGVFADRLWYNAACGFAKRILVLPANKYMTEKDVTMICNLLKNV